MKQRYLVLLLLFLCVLVAGAGPISAADRESKKSSEKILNVAAVVTVYHHNSHADVIVSRIIQSHTLDGKGEYPRMKLVSLYVDQPLKTGLSQGFSQKYGFPIYKTVSDTLTLGTGKLAVDGVLLVAEHGNYPKSPTGQVVYPKKRLFGEVIKVFKKSNRVVPVFLDKHISDNWEDAKHTYDTARRMNIPLMAGSSLPTLWRYPAADVRRNAQLQEIVAVSYHTLDAYGFHAMEMVQSLVEQRKGGETGIKSVQCLVDEAVWEAGDAGVFDVKLLSAALSRLKRPTTVEKCKDQVKNPILFVMNYHDGLRASVLTLNGAIGEWASAWRYASDEKIESTLFWTQEARPFMHFTYLLKGAEQMMQTGKPAWPAERTLLTSGALDALLISKKNNGRRLETPYLNIRYQTNWRWKEPPPPPPGRPISGQ